MIEAVLAVGTQRGVFVLRPGSESGDYSVYAQALPDQDISSLVVAPTGGLYAGSANGLVYFSPDAFQWRPLIGGMTRPGIHCLGLHPSRPEVIFAGAAPAAIYRSHDSGANWARLPTFNRVRGADAWSWPEPPYLPRVNSICQHPEDPLVVFAGVKTGGLLVSTDAGESWGERQTGLSRQVNQLLLHPLEPARLMVATDGGFYRSDDLGGEWRLSNGGLPYTYMAGVAAHSQSADILMAAVNKTAKGTGACVFRSPNGGQNWEITYQGLPPLANHSVTTIACYAGIFLVATDRGEIYGTEDLGERWQLLDANLPRINAILALA